MIVDSVVASVDDESVFMIVHSMNVTVDDESVGELFEL